MKKLTKVTNVEIIDKITTALHESKGSQMQVVYDIENEVVNVTKLRRYLDMRACVTFIVESTKLEFYRLNIQCDDNVNLLDSSDSHVYGLIDSKINDVRTKYYQNNSKT